MYRNGNDGCVPRPAQVFGLGSCEYLGPCLLLTSMTCAVLGSKPEGQDLHFEQISQLCKLIVLSFLQTPLGRRAFWQTKTPFSLEPSKYSILEQPEQMMEENRLSNQRRGRRAGSERMRHGMGCAVG